MDTTPETIVNEAQAADQRIHAADPDETDKDIFAERCDMIMNQFGEQCAENKVELAIAILINPATGIPAMFARGETFDLAKLAKFVLLQLRRKILEDLSV